MKKSMIPALTAAALLTLLPLRQAAATSILVNPNFGLEIDFTVPHPTSTIACCLGGPIIQYPPDLLVIGMGGIQINGPVGTYSSTLLNGNIELGNNTFSLYGDRKDITGLDMGIYMSPTSLYSSISNQPAVIDFSSILDGTIQGRLLFTISQGSFVFSDQSAVGGVLGLGSINTGTFGIGDNINITSIHRFAVHGAHDVPEPATLSLLGLGLVAVSGMRRRSGKGTAA